MLLVLNKEEIVALLKEKYKNAEHIELYIDYNDEGISGNDQIIAEINVPDEHLSSEELIGFFDKTNDKEDFILDLESARNERAEEILNKNKTSE